MNNFDTEYQVDRWLLEHRDAMIAALDEVIDVEAGLQDVLLSTRFTSLVDNLDEVIDVEAGLAAIVPVPEPILAPAPNTEGSDLDSVLRAISPVEKLALREAYSPLVGGTVLSVAGAVDDIVEVVASMTSNLGIVRRAKPHSEMARHELHEAGHAVWGLSRLLADCATTVSHEKSIYARVEWRLRSEAGDLHDRLGELEDLLMYWEGLSYNSTSWGLAVLDCRAATKALVRDARRFTHRLRALHRFLNDFVGADLSTAPLEGMHLVGVQWSISTLWPSQSWRDRIEKSSIEIEDGIFEVHGDESRQPTAVH
jgi:hypothetical protein